MTTLIPVVDVPMPVEASAEFSVTASVVRGLYLKLEEAGYDVEQHAVKHTEDSMVNQLWKMIVIPSLRALLLLDPKSEESATILDQLNTVCVNEKGGQLSGNVVPTETVELLRLLKLEYWEKALAARLLPGWDIAKWHSVTRHKIRISMQTERRRLILNGTSGSIGNPSEHSTLTSECRKVQNSGMSGAINVRVDLNVDVGKRHLEMIKDALSDLGMTITVTTPQERTGLLPDKVETTYTVTQTSGDVLSRTRVEVKPNQLLHPLTKEIVVDRMFELHGHRGFWDGDTFVVLVTRGIAFSEPSLAIYGKVIAGDVATLISRKRQMKPYLPEPK